MTTTYQPPARVPTQDRARPARATPPTGFRADIEGLRAVAVLLVVLSHAGVAGLAAGGYVGVDVFFVISGFLITTLLVKELRRTGRISLPGFYARRAARLLPASTLVVAVTVTAAWFWLPATRFVRIAHDAFAGTVYAMNWRLAIEGTEYLNADETPSPLQHLWSLAVEEQFYVVWPLLLLGVWAWRGSRPDPRRPIAVVAAVVAAVSLAAGVALTSTSAPWAYFGTHTRAWELAVGVVLAMAASRLARLPHTVAAVLTWAGLAAVVASAVLYDERTAFPGVAALLPVAGAAAILAGGTAGPRHGAVLLLRTPPMQRIGTWSYGWYLWHWPVLMIGPAALGLEPTVPLNLALVTFALLLTVVTYLLVEHPVRTLHWVRARARNGVGLGVALTGSAAVLTLLAGQFTPPLRTGGPAVDTTRTVAQAADPQARIVELVAAAQRARKLPSNLAPRLTAAGGELPDVYDKQCHLGYTESRPDRECVFGDPAGTKTMYLIGDSHGAHWFPTVDRVARTHGYRLVSWTKSGCQVPSVTVVNKVLKRTYAECTDWRAWALRQIRAAKPEVVLMASNDSDEGGIVGGAGGTADDQRWITGWRDSLTTLRQPGTKLVVLQDTPWPDGRAPECAAGNTRRLEACARPPGEAVPFPARRAAIAATAREAGATVVDPLPWFCAANCPVVVGNLLVYRDSSHITTRYAKMLVPVLDEQLTPVLGRPVRG